MKSALRRAPLAAAAPVRVLMMGPALDVRGGISAVERILLDALPENISVTHVATMDEGSRLAKLGVFLRALRTAWHEIGKRPDIVHLHFASRASSVRKMALARLALARGCKVILHAHGGAYPEYWKTLSPVSRAATADVLRRAHALIVLGDVWREFFTGIGVPAERIVVMPNPVVLPPALPIRVPAATTVFVYLGLVAQAKGTHDLVEAVSRLGRETRDRLRVVIAGNGDHAGLAERIARHDLSSIVELRGWLDAAARDALLASAHAFVLPSYHEGLPMALLEAMSWGLAPIATPVGAIPDVLEDNVNGVLAAPGDVNALARAIERIATDTELRTRLAAAARQRVEPLAVENYARGLSELYEAVRCRN